MLKFRKQSALKNYLKITIAMVDAQNNVRVLKRTVLKTKRHDAFLTISISLFKKMLSFNIKHFTRLEYGNSKVKCTWCNSSILNC